MTTDVHQELVGDHSMEHLRIAAWRLHDEMPDGALTISPRRLVAAARELTPAHRMEMAGAIDALSEAVRRVYALIPA